MAKRGTEIVGEALSSVFVAMLVAIMALVPVAAIAGLVRLIMWLVGA